MVLQNAKNSSKSRGTGYLDFAATLRSGFEKGFLKIGIHHDLLDSPRIKPLASSRQPGTGARRRLLHHEAFRSKISYHQVNVVSTFHYPALV